MSDGRDSAGGPASLPAQEWSFGPVRPRIGLIGAGLIGVFHSKAIRGLIEAGLVEAKYVGVCDVDAERAGVCAGLARVPDVFKARFASRRRRAAGRA